MLRPPVRRLLTAALVVSLTALWPGSTAAAQKQRQVLVLYGGNRDAQIAAVGDRQLPRLLHNGVPEGVDYYSEFVDQRRFIHGENALAFRDYLRLRYAEHDFDLIVAMDALALDFLYGNRAELFPRTPVVFFTSRTAARRLVNSTGVVAPLNFDDTLTMAVALQPRLRNVFVVNGTDAAYETRARQEFKSFEGRLTFTYLSGLPTKQLEARLAALPRDSMVFYMHVARDGDGQNFNPLEYLERVAAVANAPTYSWTNSAMNRGIVGGCLRSLEGQVESVAALAVRVLQGEKADAIPLATPDLNVREADWRQLERWGLNAASLPAGTTVRFREPSTWERYNVYVLGAVALFIVQSSLIAGLLIQRARRRQAEEKARGSEAELVTTHGRIRDLGARLIEAQETERARIARELHDDISQQLALLEIDLELLGHALPAENEALADEALDRAQAISRSVHDLSHRLHPARLRLIGLVPAIQGLRQELSRADVDVTFTHENIPANLPLDLTLSLFRVVQEGLQNALKYSGAKNVSVDLAGSAQWLSLTIVDDGVGFDVKSAWGKGLGLISIGERLESIGGAFEVHSAAGQGTRLVVRVPLLPLCEAKGASTGADARRLARADSA